MTVTCNQQKTKTRLLAIQQYLTSNVMDADFLCPSYQECKLSHSGTFYEGQLHHIGQFYDLLLDGLPLRVAVIGQEYGTPPSRVDCQTRHDTIMSCGLDYRFKAENGCEARNPHMRGTTSVLRLIFNLPLGVDHDMEFLVINGDRVHIYDAFALVNYLLCSAVLAKGGKRCMATPRMKKNCHGHFREVMHILNPTVVIVQTKNFWPWVKASFDSIRQEKDYVYRAKLGATETFVAAFTHPSARFPYNWGANDHTPYLLETVSPSIAYIHQHLRSLE
jgi:hypothetical protein